MLIKPWQRILVIALVYAATLLVFRLRYGKLDFVGVGLLTLVWVVCTGYLDWSNKRVQS